MPVIFPNNLRFSPMFEWTDHQAEDIFTVHVVGGFQSAGGGGGPPAQRASTGGMNIVGSTLLALRG
jgi:hypothetical protein